MANFSNSGAWQTYINQIKATDRYTTCQIAENGSRYRPRTIVLNNTFLWSMVQAPNLTVSSELKTMSNGFQYDLITIKISNPNPDSYSCWLAFSNITDGGANAAVGPSDRWITVNGNSSTTITTACADSEAVDCRFQSLDVSAYFKPNPYRVTSVTCQGSIGGGSSGDDDETTTTA